MRSGGENQLHHLAIEKRRPRLDRRQHRGAIDFHQQIVGQIRQEVEPHHAIQRLVREAIQFAGELGNDALVDRHRAEPGEVACEPRFFSS